MFSQKQTIGSREGVDKLEIGNFKLVDITFAEITKECYQSDSVWVNKNFTKN